MEKLSRDNLFSLAILLDLPDLLRFCSSQKRIDELICKKNDIWNYKLMNEFPQHSKIFKEMTPRKKYETVSKLSKLKDIWKNVKYNIDYNIV